MGHIEFLIGKNTASPSSLPDAIEGLEDASTVFLMRWCRSQFGRAGEVSQDAMVLLDFIANELLREKDSRGGLGTYLDSQLASEMSAACGIGVTGTSYADQLAMVHAGPGVGQLPVHLGTPKGLKLSRLLNKIKHRSPNLMNFRIDSGRHIFIICTEKSGGGAEGIYEFDVGDFCEKCRLAAQSL